MTAPRPLGYWIRTVDQLFDAQYEEAAEEAGIARREWQVLNRLRIGNVAEEAIVDALAPFVDEPESLDESLRRLEKDGLVEQRSGEYRITDRGTLRMDDVQEHAGEKIRGRATGSLSDSDYEQLLATLERIAVDLGWQPT